MGNASLMKLPYSGAAASKDWGRISLHSAQSFVGQLVTKSLHSMKHFSSFYVFTSEEKLS
jgi:hypothetical protein